MGAISRLPVSIRLVLESVLRNCDGKKVSETNVRELAQWQPKAARTQEIPFIVARIVLQDFTGVPLLVDLAAMRSAMVKLGRNPKLIEPLVPVDLVVDHSVQVDFAGTADALAQNLAMEFQRNGERYQFLKWGMQAFDTFKVVPPGIGIVHQVNLEFLAKGVLSQAAGADGRSLFYPDTLVGTDSHTTMINGLGIVGWGVGGIEAEAGMLGQPVYFLTPDVVGVHLTGALQEGVTATDLALTVTEMLRKAKVVGKFVEFYGPGAAALAVVDRATIANMAPEYGATMGFFPIDGECVDYLRKTGRSEEHCKLYENYFRAQGLFGIPKKGDIAYSTDLELDLAGVGPSVAGPKRPQDRIELGRLKEEFIKALGQARGGKRIWQNSRRIERAFPVLDDGTMAASGGSQEPVSRRRSLQQNTNPLTELEMANNRPTPDHGHAGRVSARAVASWRRVDCRDHQLHEHQQPLGHAGGRFAGQKGGRERTQAQSDGQVFPRPRFAGGERLFEQNRPATLSGPTRFQPRRLRLHDMHRQLRPAGRAGRRRGDEERRHRGGGAFRESKF